MATGNYGTVRPADVSVDDVEILYAYSPSRETLNTVEYRQKKGGKTTQGRNIKTNPLRWRLDLGEARKQAV